MRFTSIARPEEFLESSSGVKQTAIAAPEATEVTDNAGESAASASPRVIENMH